MPRCTGRLMPLDLKPIKEVRLQRSPLREVIFQVRFLPILKIGADTPVLFQDAVRPIFPHYSVERAINLDIPIALGGERAEFGPQVHKFFSRDRQSLISLSTDFLAMSTLSYSSWAEFKQLIALGLEALLGTYTNIDATRTGLRYVNAIEARTYGYQTWNQMLDVFSPELVAPINSSTVGEASRGFALQIELAGADDSTLMLNLGLNQERTAVVLDLDNFEEYKEAILLEEAETMLHKLEAFHDQVYRVFRWAVRDERLHIFRPTEEEG